jgi:hypothetical protein
MLDYEFLNSFTEGVLQLHKSIVWVGITNKFSVLLTGELKQGIDPLLTEEENEDFSSGSITRYTSLKKVSPKIGATVYAFGRYRNFCRATVPINDDFYLLLMFDPKIRKFDNLITKKIIPLVEEQAEKFVMPAD